MARPADGLGIKRPSGALLPLEDHPYVTGRIADDTPYPGRFVGELTSYHSFSIADGQRIDLAAATCSTVAFDRQASPYVLLRMALLDHGVAMAHARLTELDLSYHTEGLPDRDTYLTVTSACLSDALPGNLIGWTSVDLANSPVKMWFNNAETYRMRHLIDAMLVEHPIVAHQLAHPDSEPVLRVSDCISDREFRSSRVYREIFVPQGARYQLNIATDGDPTVNKGWFIKRSTRDFTDADLRHARHLQPMLALLDTVYASSPPIRRADSAQIEEARKRARLTVRELDILTLLADGLSAQRIARLRRISVRTVHKHLENSYQKLECHDRLLAVNKAQQLGLLRA